MTIDRITTGAVLDGAIQTADIANLAIDNDKLATNAVTAEKMAPGAAFVTGMVMPYAGVVDNGSNPVPSGWLLCDGSEKDASTYVALKNLLQTTYGPYTNGSGGTGTTHFRVPDLRGKVIAALDNMGGGSANIINAIPNASYADNLGGVLGVEQQTLTAAQSGMPSHGHANTLGINTSGLGISNVVNSVTIYGARGGGGDDGNFYHNGLVARNINGQGNSFTNQATTSANSSAGNQAHTASITSSLTGSASITGGVTDNSGTDASAAHQLMQPTMFMNYIIKT
jgi:microcystin-dependent protein